MKNKNFADEWGKLSISEETENRILDKIEKKLQTEQKRLTFKLRPAIIVIGICIIFATTAVAASINYIINTFWINETIMMNEIRTNRLNEFIDARISAGIPSVNGTDDADDGSVEYQILLKPVQTPCYVYMHYYRGYLKALILDEQTDNIDEVNEWLRNNGGIVARAASTPEEAARILSADGSGRTTPAKIREAMGDGCMLPGYLPKGGNGNIMQYSKNISTVNITYFYEGKADFDTRGQINNYIALGITDTNTEFGKNLSANLAVTQNIEISEINGYDIYISDRYYIWEHNGFIYVLYNTDTMHEEIVKIIENMR